MIPVAAGVDRTPLIMQSVFRDQLTYLLTEVGRRAIGKVDRLVRAGEILDCGGVDVDEKRQTEDRIQIRKKLLVDMTNDLRHYG